VHYGSNIDFKSLQLADILAHATFQWKRDAISGESAEGKFPPLLECLRSAYWSIGVMDFQSLEHIQMDVAGRFSSTATQLRAERIKFTIPQPDPSEGAK
jgi:hypothetical protein